MKVSLTLDLPNDPARKRPRKQFREGGLRSADASVRCRIDVPSRTHRSKAGLGALIVSFLLVSGATPALAAAARPNVLLILIDDLGWRDLGFMGSSYYETPHIDRLAGEGTVFNQAYSNAPNCAPARASLLSGQYSPRHGIYSVPPSARGESRLRRLVVEETGTSLPLEVVTLAESLAQAGYATASVGKWHLGGRGFAPTDQGFDFSIAGNARGIPPSYFWPYEFTNRRGQLFRIRSLRQGGSEGEYLTDRLTDEAVAWLEKNAKQPFFLYLSHYAVHAPIQARENIVAKYRAKTPHAEHDDPRYAAMIESVDESVGRLLSKLGDLGIANDTIVVLFSDNGGSSVLTSMAPLRGSKGMLYEGGIRSPLIVHWPGRVAADATSEVPVMGIDLYPTILRMTDTPAPEGHVLDGRSLTPLLGIESDERAVASLEQRPLFWHFPAYLEAYPGDGKDFRTTPVGVIRQGSDKLLEYFEDHRLELYDLSSDRGERTNLASTRPKKVRELHERMRRWRKTIDAPVPTVLNPEFDPAARALRP